MALQAVRVNDVSSVTFKSEAKRGYMFVFMEGF